MRAFDEKRDITHIAHVIETKTLYLIAGLILLMLLFKVL